MPISFAVLTPAFLILSICFAWFRGGSPERYGAAVLLSILLLQILGFGFRHQIYNHVDPVSVVIDLFALINFGVLAVLANRVWPIWASSLQILSLNAHVARAVDLGFSEMVYGLMKSVPTLLVIVILAAGTMNHARLMKRYGRDPDWR